MQRALLQYTLPKNKALVARALQQAGREDLAPALLGHALPGAGGSVARRPAGTKGAKAGPKAAGAKAHRGAKNTAGARRAGAKRPAVKGDERKGKTANGGRRQGGGKTAPKRRDAGKNRGAAARKNAQG